MKRSGMAVPSTALFADSDRGAGEQGGKPRKDRMCLELLGWLLLDHHGTMADYAAVMSGTVPCPHRHGCRKYLTAAAAGKTFEWDTLLSANSSLDRYQPKKAERHG